jgi:hypothetical protein
MIAYLTLSTCRYHATKGGCVLHGLWREGDLQQRDLPTSLNTEPECLHPSSSINPPPLPHHNLVIIPPSHHIRSPHNHRNEFIPTVIPYLTMSTCRYHATKGGCVLMGYGAKATFNNVTFLDCTTGDGGAVQMENAGTLGTFNSCNFTRNTASRRARDGRCHAYPKIKIKNVSTRGRSTLVD